MFTKSIVVKVTSGKGDDLVKREIHTSFECFETEADILEATEKDVNHVLSLINYAADLKARAAARPANEDGYTKSQARAMTSDFLDEEQRKTFKKLVTQNAKSANKMLDAIWMDNKDEIIKRWEE